MSAPGHRRPAGHARIEAAKAARAAAPLGVSNARPYILGAAGRDRGGGDRRAGVHQRERLQLDGRRRPPPCRPARPSPTAPPPARRPRRPPARRARLPRHQRLPAVHQPGQPLHRHVRHHGRRQWWSTSTRPTRRAPSTTSSSWPATATTTAPSCSAPTPRSASSRAGRRTPTARATRGRASPSPTRAGPTRTSRVSSSWPAPTSPTAPAPSSSSPSTTSRRSLDAQGTYVVFGTVTKGLDVLQAILATNVESGGLGGAPSPEVTVKSVTIGEASIASSTGD